MQELTKPLQCTAFVFSMIFQKKNSVGHLDLNLYKCVCVYSFLPLALTVACMLFITLAVLDVVIINVVDDFYYMPVRRSVNLHHVCFHTLQPWLCTPCAS